MRYLKSIYCDVKQWFLSLNAKRVLVILIVALFIATPTFFAFGYVIHNEYLRQDSAFSVALYSDKDALIMQDDKADDGINDSVSSIFSSLTENPEPLDKGIQNPYNTNYIKAIVTVNGASSELKCYFSTDSEEGYFTNEKGQSFIIPAELNKRFLSTEYAESFYSASVCHSLLSIDGDTILPSNTEWYYKSVSGEYLSASGNKLSGEQKTYEITGALDIFFDIEPDICTVRVYQGNECIYSGSQKELSSLTFDSKGELRVTAEAVWEQDGESDNYGRITYDFFVHIKNRSSFYVSSTEIISGGFIILDCTNITDISKISLKSNQDSLSPIFRRYNGYVRTVIHFPESDEEYSFEFTISYGASSQDFIIRVLPSEISGEFYSSELLFGREDEPDSVNKSIEKAITTAVFPENEYIYFQGNFANPAQNGFDVAYTHNGIMYWGENSEYSYVTLGNEYISDKLGGASVTSIQNGTVALIGSSRELGNYVVIDHGCGLRTWYASLGNVDVNVGDIVLVGQHIGKAGAGTLEGKEGFKLFCTVNNTVINPNTLW